MKKVIKALPRVGVGIKYGIPQSRLVILNTFSGSTNMMFCIINNSFYNIFFPRVFFKCLRFLGINLIRYVNKIRGFPNYRVSIKSLLCTVC